MQEEDINSGRRRSLRYRRKEKSTIQIRRKSLRYEPGDIYDIDRRSLRNRQKDKFTIQTEGEVGDTEKTHRSFPSLRLCHIERQICVQLPKGFALCGPEAFHQYIKIRDQLRQNILAEGVLGFLFVHFTFLPFRFSHNYFARPAYLLVC